MNKFLHAIANIRTLYTLIFGLAVYLFFAIAYPHHLHYQEHYQLFLFDCGYVWDIVKLPGGVADLLGRFCTQFFLYASVGAFIIALLLTAVQLLTQRLVGWGCLYGLSFVPAFLLWLFLLDENALLGGVWAVLLTLLAVWVAGRVGVFAKEGVAWRWLRGILLLTAAPVLYWMVGPVCIIFFLLHRRGQSANSQSTKGKGQWLVDIAALVLVLLTPFVLSHRLPVPLGNLQTGVHYYRYPTIIPTLLWVAVLTVVVLTFLAGCLKRWTNAFGRSVFTHVFLLLVVAGMGLTVAKNSNLKAEKVMQYDFMACHQQWNRILETIQREKPNNQIGVTVQNLALAMRGQLVNQMGNYNQNGLMGLLPEVQRDATSSMPTAEALYQLGMTYAAQRTVFEAQEAILDFQKSGRCYKRLAETNLINGSYEVARKYLTALQKTLFYSDWANETMLLLGNEEAIDRHPEYGRLRKMAYGQDFYFSDQVTPQMLKDLYLSNTDNSMAYQYMLAAFALTGDRDSFLQFASNPH